MERWVPLFEIFLNSPSPEGEASMWLQQQQLHHQSKPPHGRHPTADFLSLLLTPTDVVFHQSATSPPILKRCVWLQTLPCAMQSRILSFLAAESYRFCSRDLSSLATQILDSITVDDDKTQKKVENFWVFRAARNLLDAIPTYHPTPGIELEEQGGVIEEDEEEEEDKEEEFDDLPKWLKTVASTAQPLLPWLPVSSQQLCRRTKLSSILPSDRKVEHPVAVEGLEETMREAAKVPPSAEVNVESLGTQIHERAATLKAEIQLLDTPATALRISHNVQQLCVDAGGGKLGRNCAAVLSLVEPWKADDETAPLLLSHLLGSSDLGYSEWPSHVLSAVVLPKLMFLQRPVSRVLLSTIIDFCKSHQKGSVSSMLFPLIHLKEGINTPICDVLARVMKECFHPSHVSAFCQKLLCMKRVDSDFVCLPIHRNLISDELIWTESLFSLFQHILALDVPLTPDTIDKLISVLNDMNCKFSKSLKFGSFLLCLVTKSEHALKFHKLSLIRVAEKTDTFVTKSIWSKLG